MIGKTFIDAALYTATLSGPLALSCSSYQIISFCSSSFCSSSSLHLSALCKSYMDRAVRNLYLASRSFNCYRECKEGYLIKCSLICYSAELEILSNIHLEIKDEMISSWK